MHDPFVPAGVSPVHARGQQPKAPVCARRAAQEIANSLWAFATLEHHTGAQLLDASAVQIARRIEQFSPQVRATFLTHTGSSTSSS